MDHISQHNDRNEFSKDLSKSVVDGIHFDLLTEVFIHISHYIVNQTVKTNSNVVVLEEKPLLLSG